MSTSVIFGAYAAVAALAFGFLVYVDRKVEPEGDMAYPVLMLCALLWPLFMLVCVGFGIAKATAVEGRS